MEVALLKMSYYFWCFLSMKDDNRVCLAGGIIQKAYTHHVAGKICEIASDFVFRAFDA